MDRRQLSDEKLGCMVILRRPCDYCNVIKEEELGDVLTSYLLIFRSLRLLYIYSSSSLWFSLHCYFLNHHSFFDS